MTARYRYAPRGSYRAWIAGIVAEDAQDNGGWGLLEPCVDCGGAGYVPATGAEHYAAQDDAGYVKCPSCAGTGYPAGVAA